MKTKLSKLLSGIGLIGCGVVLGVSQSRASILYDVSGTAGLASYSGTITTDGNTGPLGAGDISDWNLTITVTGSPTLTYVLTPSNSMKFFDGADDLSATLSTLTWNTSSTIGNVQSDFYFKLNGGPPNIAVVEYFQSDSINPSELDINSQNALGGYTTEAILGSPDNFGTAASTTTPLPAALPLLASGLGALGLLGWRRKRKNAAAFPAA